VNAANRTRRLAPLSDESGFGLIEVLVSALLVVLVASGVYLGLDAASATSGINKRRSVSSELAQQDQDRMRSMTVNDLSNYRDTRTATVASIDYTIDSRASWVTDSTGSASCTSGAAGANYLNITSTVTWPTMTVPPVTVESIVAPPVGSFTSDQGSIAVQVRDRNGAGVPGVTVSLSGARNYTDVTNAQGCVLWGYLPAGNYDVDVAKTGYVDPQGVQQPTKPVGVVGAATNTVAFDYDLGGRIQADYESWSGGAPVPANGTEFTAVSSHLTVPLSPFGDGAPHASFTSGLVFPFTDPYGVYAGNCAGADPLANGQPAALAQVNPGATVVVAVREPPVNLRVMNGALPVANATVKLTGTGSGCGALPPRTTAANGYLVDPAYPYGTYSACVQAAGRAQTVTLTSATTLANTSPTGIPAGIAATFDMTTAPAGTCP
jgi:Tfp pilus assembly protein PilV